MKSYFPLALAAQTAILAACATPTPSKTEVALTQGSWQYGLYGEARVLPVGLAFKRGITATVLTLKPDGTLRMEIPCRNEEFIAKHGEVLFTGTWKLQQENLLVLNLSFRGESRVETSTVTFQGEVLTLTSRTGEDKHLGRFYGNVSAPCVFE